MLSEAPAALERFGFQILVAQHTAASIITLHGVVDAPDVVVGRVVQVAADDLYTKELQLRISMVLRAALSLWAAWMRTDARASSLRAVTAQPVPNESFAL